MELMKAIESTHQEDLRGFELASSLDPTSASSTLDGRSTADDLTEQEYQLLYEYLHRMSNHTNLYVPKQVLRNDRISSRGICYGVYASRYHRDSTVIFQLSDDPPRNVHNGRAGRVQGIFKHPLPEDNTSMWYLVVEEFSRINRPNFVDPYPMYGFAAGFLCKEEPCTTHIIEVCHIRCHYVQTALPEANAYHVMPMDMVSNLPS